jgi:cytosine/adenosine deaminase-related metal-dependent hydrolase
MSGPTPDKRCCDLLIRNATLLPMGDPPCIIAHGAVAVQGHTIAAVGQDSELGSSWVARRSIDAQGAIVHPGYVEAHLHVNAQTCRGYFRGDASRGGSTGPNYADWKAALEPQDEAAATQLAAIELLRHGFTCFVEPGSAFAPDAVVEAAGTVGIRCSVADPYLWDETAIMQVIGGLASDSLFARVPPTRQRVMGMLGGQLFRNRDPDGIAHGHVALYGEGTASDELWRAAKALADREGVILNSHLGFDVGVATAMEQQLGTSRFAHLDRLGVLGPNATFVHMNILRDDEIAILRQRGIAIVWCPQAYVTRGLPLVQPTRLPALARDGIAVGLGTDSARQSSVGDAIFLALNLSAEAGTTLAAEEVLIMATRHAARAAGLHDRIGQLTPGFRADIVIRGRGVSELGPCIDPAHQLVGVGHGPTADTVLVNGRIVLHGGRPTQVDEFSVIETARRSAMAVAARLGLPPAGRWERH